MKALGVVIPVCIAFAVLPHALAPTPDAAVKKCGQVVEKALVALDGKITEMVLDELSPDEIHIVETVCMDPEDSTFNADRGIPVVSIWTKDGPAPQMRPLLAHVHEFQTSHHQRHGAYAVDLDALDMSGFPGAIEVFLRVNDDGWLAVAAIDRLLSRCVVFDGRWPSPNPSLVAGEPECLSRDQFSAAVWPEPGP